MLRRQSLCFDAQPRQSNEWRRWVYCVHRCMNKWLCHPNCCSWMKHFIGRTSRSSMWIRSLAGLTDSVSHSRLTGSGASAVSQRWLTVWQGEKTCSTDYMFRQAWEMVCTLVIPHSHKQYLSLSLIHKHGAKQLLLLYPPCASMCNVII